LLTCVPPRFDEFKEMHNIFRVIPPPYPLHRVAGLAWNTDWDQFDITSASWYFTYPLFCHMAQY